jgi:hypothetical protein
MKTMLLAALIVSTSAFATELDATDALLQTVAAGQYTGITPQGSDCEVSIRNLSNRVAIVASAEGVTKRSEVYSGATYRWKPGQRSFLASTFTTTLNGSKENVFRTIAVSTNTQYVVVADLIEDNRNRVETKVECIIDL